MDADIMIPEEARQRYLERRKADIDTLRTAVQAKNFEEFKRIGHQLKGNAASFGYADLEKIAIQLEVVGEREDIPEALRQLDAFQAWLNRNKTT